MKTTQGAAHNHIMPTTKVPRPRMDPKTFWVTCSYFTTLPKSFYASEIHPLDSIDNLKYNK